MDTSGAMRSVGEGAGSLDRRFVVGFEHRVRFTRGVFDPGNPALRAVLGSTAGRGSPARVALVVDGGLAASDTGVVERAAAYIEGSTGVELAAPVLLIPGGEESKNEPQHLESVLKLINDARLCRRSYLIAVGGGAVLDVAGYAAAVAHRGIRLIRLPSTTLSQDDSGVGVKNGVNAFGKKNFIGSFAVPHAVVNDLDLLGTLSDRDWRSGFSEAVKVALVKDGAFFEEIERAAEAIARRDMAAAEGVIGRSAELHLKHIVEGGDAFESRLARPLDFGHWSAHRLEQMSGFEVRHGEAVAIGVGLDTVYSHLCGSLALHAAERVLVCLRSLGFELDHPLLGDSGLLTGLEEFREHLGGPLTVSLLRGIGEAYDAHEIRADLVSRSAEALRAWWNGNSLASVVGPP